ncbi:MAG: Clp protease ClpP [Lacticaseibacillus paracasei]|nr:Clp protease ClpP [Lacticaseibacillus paracasei]
MTTVVPIKGDIVTNDYGWLYDLFGDDYASPKSVSDVINKANGDDLSVEINSGGGIVDAGSEIYTMLRAYKGPVNVNVVGVAYSAASLIAMAGDVVAVSPAGMMMIHNVSSGQMGDYHDMQNAADSLKKSNIAIANAYMAKTGLSQTEILDLMDSTYWLDPQTAIEKGFADKMMFDNAEKPGKMIMTASLNKIPSLATLNQMKHFRNTTALKKAPSDDDQMALLNAEYNLLNLKGE